MKVKDIMTSDPSTVSSSSTCGEAATIMKNEDCGSVPVVDRGKLVGIVTDRDITIRAVAAGKDPKTTKVSDVMSADPFTIGPDDDADEASKLMAERQVRRLPVVEGGRLVGLLAIGQLARRDDVEQTGETLKDISEPNAGGRWNTRGAQ